MRGHGQSILKRRVSTTHAPALMYRGGQRLTVTVSSCRPHSNLADTCQPLESMNGHSCSMVNSGLAPNSTKSDSRHNYVGPLTPSQSVSRLLLGRMFEGTTVNHRVVPRDPKLFQASHNIALLFGQNQKLRKNLFARLPPPRSLLFRHKSRFSS